jgi:hypothetical protein
VQIDNAVRLIFLDEFLAARLDDFAVSHGNRLSYRKGIVYHENFGVVQEEIDVLRLRRRRAGKRQTGAQ